MVKWTADYLGGKGMHNARLNAELLLAGVLGLKRLDLYLQFDRLLTPAEIAEFKGRLQRRARREPLQYIDGWAAFRNLRLAVDPRVLIPRPETEQLVGAVLDWARERGDLEAVDVGTGSGAIALALATEGPFRRVVATDLSAAALEVARANHAATGPEAPVEFREGDGLAPVRGERFDVLVSNPPYVAPREREEMDPEVRDYEPGLALFAEEDGMAVLRAVVHGAPEVLRAGGLLALEIGAEQGARVAGLIRDVPGFAEPEVRRDLAGRDRIVLAHFHGRGAS